MAKKRNFRNTPNVLVTGTPGTGKTTFSGMLAEAVGFRHINVGDWVKERQLHTGWDDEHQCFTLDEDKVCAKQTPCGDRCTKPLRRPPHLFSGRRPDLAVPVCFSEVLSTTDEWNADMLHNLLHNLPPAGV